MWNFAWIPFFLKQLPRVISYPIGHAVRVVLFVDVSGADTDNTGAVFTEVTGCGIWSARYERWLILREQRTNNKTVNCIDSVLPTGQ